MKTISIEVLLKSDLITTEESYSLIERFVVKPQITAAEILELDLPAKNRVEALLQSEFLNEGKLRELACDFAAHTLHIFDAHAPGDYRPHECLSIAFLLNTWSIGSWQHLRETIREARPAMWRLEGTEHAGAVEACRATLLMAGEDAGRMAREVAVCAQIAAHRNAWENRRSNTLVRRKFPELSEAVVSRYLQYQAALRKESARRLRHAVRIAAQEIMGSGQYVSEARVREHVRRYLPKLGRDSLFKQALCEVKLELDLTK